MRSCIASGALALSLLLVACGGGGGGGGGGGFPLIAPPAGAGTPAPANDPPATPANPAGAWLSLEPNKVDLTTYPNLSKSFSVEATSSRTIRERISVAIIDPKGVIVPKETRIELVGALKYRATMNTDPTLKPGVYTGSFEVRLCYDANPLVCERPVEGSPWHLPYRIEILNPSQFHYASWQRPSGGVAFSENIMLSTLNGKLVLVGTYFVSRTMQVWVSGSSGWLSPTATDTPPSVSDFALASDGQSIYLSGGQSADRRGVPYANAAHTGAVWKFDGTSWHIQTPDAAFGARGKHVMTKLGNTLFVAGGYSTGRSWRDVWRSQDDGASWSKVLDSLPDALGAPTCGLEWQGQWLLVGDKVATSPDGVSWTIHEGSYPASFPKGSTRCAVMNGRLFIVPVNDSANVVSTDNLSTWQLEPPALEFPGRVGFGHQPGMVSLDGRLMFIGYGNSLYRTVP